MQVKITVPDDIAEQLIKATCVLYGYKSTLPDGSVNPQSLRQFAEGIFVTFAKEIIKTYQSQLAAEEARQATMQSTELTLNEAAFVLEVI